MNRTPATRLLLVASAGLLLITRPGLASDGPAAAAKQTDKPLSVASADTPDTAPAVGDTDAPAHAAQDVAAAQEDAKSPSAGDEHSQADAPSSKWSDTVLLKMDRSGWPIIRIAPADGSVTHNPTYMGNPPMGDDIVSPLNAPDPVWQIQEALLGTDAGNYNSENLVALGVQPIIGVAKIFLIPFRAVFEHPWSDTTSP